MSYVQIENGVVVQKQPSYSDGFIEASESVVCGMLYDGNDFYYPEASDEDKLASDKDSVRSHYQSAMDSLRNGYSQAEANTFHRKTSAADAYLNSTATDMQIYYLALIDGVVDGSAIADVSTVPAAVAAIDEAGMAIVAERVQKIVIARTTFDLYSAKAEQMREEALDSLVLGADNSAVIDGLAAAYAALGA